MSMQPKQALIRTRKKTLFPTFLLNRLLFCVNFTFSKKCANSHHWVHLYRTTPNFKMFEFRQALHKRTSLKCFWLDFSLSKKQIWQKNAKSREKTPSSHWPAKEFSLVCPTTEKEVQNGENHYFRNSSLNSTKIIF